MKLGIAQTVLWTLGCLLATILAASVVMSFRPHADPDPIVITATQVVVYFSGAALFAARRPGRSWSETFAARRTSIWIILLAGMLGVAVCLPASALATFLASLRPMNPAAKAAYDSFFEIRTLSQGIAFYVFAAVIGPFAEELLFRGALYSGLRPAHTPMVAGATTSLLFTFTHLDPRHVLPILGVALMLAVVRAVSGSLWPSVFMHVGFNATSLAMPSVPRLENPSTTLVAGCLAASAVLLGATVWVGRVSKSADQARRVDLEPDPGLGETLS